MPPRTDCSAGISCGGLRLPSELRVPSIESRCVTDKAAVLHCVRSSWWGICGGCAVCRVGGPSSGTCCAASPTTPAGPDIFRLTPCPRSNASSTGFPQAARSTRSLGNRQLQCAGPKGNRVLMGCLRYVSARRATHKAHSSAPLWITCAQRSPACAQPVGEAVEIKFLWRQYRPRPAETLLLPCGLNNLFPNLHPQPEAG